MTIASTTRRAGPYSGNDSTTEFSFAFKVFAEGDIQVFVTDTSITTQQTLDVDYSVSLNADQDESPGGTITYPISGDPLATGLTLDIQGDIAYTQPAALPQGGNFSPRVIENALDRLTMQTIQLSDALGLGDIPGGVSLSGLPNAAARAGLLLGFDDEGNAEVVAPSSGSAAELAINLASDTDVLKGAGQVGFGGGLNYVAGTIGARLLDIGASPMAFGATGDGVADDTAYIVQALLYSSALDLSNRDWKITSTITLPDNCTINMRGANIVLACGATPGFYFAGVGLKVEHSLGAAVTGTASCVFKFEGSTNTPTLFSQYASLISIYDLRINSSTITTGILMSKAVNTVDIINADFFCPSAIDASGKCVDVTVTNSTLFSATGIASTRGIKLRSVGGTTYYNEGWSIVGCTIDNFEISHDVADVYVYQVVGGYHGANSTLAATTGYAFKFQAPTASSLTDTISIGGGVIIAGRTLFAASAGGQAYSAEIDAVWVGVPGTAVSLENNAAYVTVRGKFKAGSGTAIGVVGAANNPGIVVEADFDSTYTNGVVLNGSVGTDCVIGPLSGAVSGDIFGGSCSVRLVGIPQDRSGVRSFRQVYSTSNLGNGATYAVAATIDSLAVSFAKGETGEIQVHLPFSGANASTQGVQLTLPTGMEVASGTGWAATNIYLRAANGLVSVNVKYWTTAAGSGSVVLKNLAGNTITIQDQAWMGVVKDM